MQKKIQLKKKVCKFCVDRINIDYKDVNLLKRYITDRAKILSRRITGNCPRHQHKLTNAIKIAKRMALLPCKGLISE